MRRSLTALVLAVLSVVLAAAPAGAVLNGRPDGENHPYVGLVTDFEFVCSGSAISPTLFVTAAHCFEEPGTQVFITFHPDGVFSETFATDLVSGHWYPDPAYCPACAPGLPGFDTHDVAVVVLDAPVDLARYAELPEEGLVDGLGKGTQVTSVGYGIQVREKKLDDELFTRYAGVSDVSRSRGRISEEFLKLSANPAQGKSGTCFGDSGGPNLLRGTDTILSINSFVTNGNCAGVTYSYRIDTAEALAFIGQFL
jgi:hypothetical protein